MGGGNFIFDGKQNFLIKKCQNLVILAKSCTNSIFEKYRFKNLTSMPKTINISIDFTLTNVCRRGSRADVSVWHVTNCATDIYF